MDSLLGHIIIAVIALLLGASVTAFCLSLKKHKGEEKREEDL